MLVSINEATFLGPFFSKLVREHSDDGNEAFMVKKMLPMSACIGASLRNKEVLSVSSGDLLGMMPIVLSRRVRFRFDKHAHFELYSYLESSGKSAAESLVWLAELHAASFYGAVSPLKLPTGHAGSDRAVPTGASPVALEQVSHEAGERVGLDRIGEQVTHGSQDESSLADPQASSEFRSGQMVNPELSQGGIRSDSRRISPSEPSNNNVDNAQGTEHHATAEEGHEDADDTFNFLSEMAQKDRG